MKNSKISNDPNEKKDLQRFTQDVKKAVSFADKVILIFFGCLCRYFSNKKKSIT